MLFNVLTGQGLTNNSMKSGDRKATERQTKVEHDKLLDVRTLPSYQRILVMPPGPQKSIAIAALNAEAKLREREYAKYWNDKLPRRNIAQSSSWVGNVNYDPYSYVMTVQLGDKSYAYPNMNPDAVSKFVNSDSLGKYLNKVNNYTGK